MNILMISLHADPTVPAGIGEGGGTHSYIRELLTCFSAKNINVLLITRKCNPDIPKYEQISETCKIHRIIVKGESPINKKELFTLHDISMSRVKDVLKATSFRPDLIHSIYWNSGQIANELGQYLKIPFVHTVISNGLRRKIAGMDEAIVDRFSIEKEIFQNALYIFCITPSEKEDLRKLYQIDSNKIVIPGRPVSTDFLYPAHDEFGNPYLFKLDKDNSSLKSNIILDFGSFSDNKISSSWWNKKAFLYCGRIASNKGVDIIIKAWINLNEKCADNCPPLWIVGGTLDEIENLRLSMNPHFNLEKYEACGELIWWGYLDQRGISALFLKTIALIMHSSYEPGGRVIIEALAAGVPVIATPNGFGIDYITDWFNGFQVSYKDIDSLYNTMLLFVKQPYLSNNLGINAKRYMSSILHEWNFSDLHYTIYQSAINDKKLFVTNSDNETPFAKYINYINMYPFFNDIITIESLYPLLKNYFGNSLIIKCYEYPEDQALWIAQISDSQYEVCQPYTKLLEKCYYNSFFHKYVDTRSDIYFREKYASDLIAINPIIASFDDYCIYIKRCHKNINYENLLSSYGISLIQELFIKFESSTYSIPVAETTMQLFSKNWSQSSADEIEGTIQSYFELLPDYIYRSDKICLGLSLRQIYFILIDTLNCIPTYLVDLYFKCIDFLNLIAYTTTPSIRLCLEDCSIRNIVYDEFNSNYLFKSAKTIYWGDNSRMIAHFIYSCLLCEQYSNNDTIEIYIQRLGNVYNKKLCLGWLFEIAFDQTIYSIIIKEKEKYQKNYSVLCKLISEFID